MDHRRTHIDREILTAVCSMHLFYARQIPENSPDLTGKNSPKRIKLAKLGAEYKDRHASNKTVQKQTT